MMTYSYVPIPKAATVSAKIDFRTWRSYQDFASVSADYALDILTREDKKTLSSFVEKTEPMSS